MFFNRLDGKCQLRVVTGVVLICSIGFFAGTANSSDCCRDAPSYPRPIAYYKLDSDLLDSSNNALFYGDPKNLASVGSAQYVSGMDGQALGLDGSFYVKATDGGLNDLFDFGSNQDFSLSFWYKTSAAVADNYILAKGTSGAGYRVFLNSDGSISVNLHDGVHQVTITSSSSGTNDGEWHHFAGSFNKGGLGKIYIDGQPNVSTSIASILAMENAHDFTIGLGVVSPFDVYMDEVKIYDKALTDQEALNIFNQRAVAYYKFDSDANDYSGNNNHGSFSYFVPGVRGNAADILSEEYIEIPDSASLDTTTDAMTISAWVKIRHYLADPGNVLAKSYFGGPPEDEEGSYRFSTDFNGDLILEISDINGDWYGGVLDVASTALSNDWYHFVGIYDGSEIYAYLNGVKSTNTFSYTGGIKVSSAPVRIASRDELGANEMDAGFDEVKIFKAALPYEEICRLYFETPEALNDVMPGDFEPDGDVDLADLKYLTRFWLDSDCQTPGCWCKKADLDKDGTVNMLDFAIIASNWLAEYELF